MKDNIIRNRPAFFAAALTVTVLLFILELAVGSHLAPESTATWPTESFLASERDDHGSTMAAILSDEGAVARSSEPTTFLVGGSTLREGLLPDLVIEQQLAESSRQNSPSIVTLYSFDQSIAESARIALSLQLLEGDTVVLDVNPRRFGLDSQTLTAEWADSRYSLLDGDPLFDLASGEFTASERTGTSSPGAEVASIGESRLFAPWRYLSTFENRFFLRNWISGRLPAETTGSWAALTSGQLNDASWSTLADFSLRSLRRPLRYAYGNDALDATAKDQFAWTVETTRVPEYFENREFEFKLADLLIAELQTRGVDVVLLELPRAPASVQAYSPVWDDYNARVDELASNEGVRRLDLRSASFDDDDFYDLEHLLAPSRDALTQLVIAGLLDDVN